MKISDHEVWFALTAYNTSPVYGWGTEADAEKYCAWLNRNRDINVFGYREISRDDPLIERLEGGYHYQLNLADELAAIAELHPELE